MPALMMHGQNGCILFTVMRQFGIRESFPLASVSSGFFGYASGFGRLRIWVKYWGTCGLLGLATSRTRTLSSKGMLRLRLLLARSPLLEPSFGVCGKSVIGWDEEALEDDVGGVKDLAVS